MPIKGAVISEGATLTPSGGSSVTYSNIVSTGPGVVTQVTAVADARVRPTSIHTSKPSTYDSITKKFSKDVCKVYHKRPKLDTDGTLYTPGYRLEVEGHPLLSAAERQAIWDHIAMVATDADYAAFRAGGALD